ELRSEAGVILVIDDETDWIAECRFMLDSFGYASTSATTAEEALVRVADRNVTTVITDYNMPGCDGISLIQELSARAALQDRQLRFIMATGHATLDVAIGAMRASAIDFLQKPVSREDLKRALLRVHGIEMATPARATLVSQLAGLSSEMQRISSLIGSPGFTPASEMPGSERESRSRGTDVAVRVDAAFIRRLIRTEANRRKLANGAIFGDPAWDMLLDLIAAKLEGRNVSVSSACIASGAPTTTALRLVNRLVDENVLCRVPDERDGRRDFLVINPDIEGPFMAYLGELANS
ncbi:MAG: hypothetical protein JWR77_1159, partial [Rhizorhabdus sp.]|nr:hypothetical protein [Rhizorhabdus sp.]